MFIRSVVRILFWMKKLITLQTHTNFKVCLKCTHTQRLYIGLMFCNYLLQETENDIFLQWNHKTYTVLLYSSLLPPTALSEVCLWALLSLTSNIKSYDFLPPPAIRETPLCCCEPQLWLFFFFSPPLPPPASHKQTNWSKRVSQQCAYIY